MFKCGQCGEQMLPKVKAQMKVVEKRSRIYRNAAGQEIGRGWEIVKEIQIGPCCIAE